MGIVFLSVSILTGALGQVFLKMGVEDVKKIGSENIAYYLDLLKNLWVYLGGFSYAVSFIFWMNVLKYYDVSFARPLTSIGYIITYILAVFLLGEGFTIRRLSAIILITIGVILLR